MSNGAVLSLHPLGLSLAVNPGETYRTVLNRFNAFRSPYHQISALRTPAGQPIALDTPIHGYTIVHVAETQMPSPFTYKAATEARS